MKSVSNLTYRLAKAVLEEYQVRPNYFQEKYCRFCGEYTKQQTSTLPNGQKQHITLWLHTGECPVPEAEDYVKNNSNE